VEGSAVPLRTIDYGSYPVTQTATFENTPLDLPPLEDSASIQLALIDGLQVASANVQKMHIPIGGVRSVTFTENGTPLARRTTATTSRTTKRRTMKTRTRSAFHVRQFHFGTLNPL
jgi:hypothetical protein